MKLWILDGNSSPETLGTVSTMQNVVPRPPTRQRVFAATLAKIFAAGSAKLRVRLSESLRCRKRQNGRTCVE